MRYFPRLSLSVWALLALLAGSSVYCLSPAWSADQKPLVINPTTGRTEQLQADNTLSLPANLFSMLRTTTDPSGTSNPFLVAQTVALTGNNANRPYAAFTWTTTDTAFNYTGFYNRALQVTSSHIGSGTVSSLTSLNADSVMNKVGGTATRMTSMRAAGPTVLAGTVTTGNALYLDDAAATGTLTTYNALEIAPIAAGTTRRAIYTQGAGVVVISDTTNASSSTAGAVVVGNGTASTTVAVGSGKINAGDTGIFQGAVNTAGAVLTIGNNSRTGNTYSAINSAAGNRRCLTINTADVGRWEVGGNQVAETGANAGTNFVINARSDAGADLGDALAIVRSTRKMFVYGDLSAESTTEATAPGTAGTVVQGGLGVVKRSYLGTIATTFKGNVDAGVQDGTAAVAGQVGEELKSTVSGVAVAGTGTVGNVTSVSLTRGDWLISGYFTVSGGATGLTNGSTVNCSIVTTSATNGTLGDTMQQQTVHSLVANGFCAMSIPAKRVNISATTTYYLTEQVTYGGGSPTVAGTLTATRMR